MMSVTRAILLGVTLAVAFTGGLWVGIDRNAGTRADRVLAPQLPARAEPSPALLGLMAGLDQTSAHLDSIQASADALIGSLRACQARERARAPADALEATYRAHLAREGLTPRVSHEAR